MAVSGREKLAMGREIDSRLNDLKTASGRQKLSLGREIDGLLAKLTGKAAEIVKSLFQEIAQGIHDALGAVEVFKKIKAEINRIDEDTIAFDIAINDQLKAACVKNAELAETEGLFA